MIQAPSLSASPRLRHGFFTRAGGSSRGIYASLNCGPGSSDDPAAVDANRSNAMGQLGLPAAALCTVHQVHGTEVAFARAPWPDTQRPEADAVVTDVPGVAVGVLTADCAPVLMADAQAGVAAAVHCGWRGALAGVVEAAVAAMENRGARRGRVAAAIGPCIAQASYEVGSEFEAAFIAADTTNARFFLTGENGRARFDLAGYLGSQLDLAGIGAVEEPDTDTYGDAARFFSYRRATHAGEPDYGRQLSAIALAPR